jgi:hypothetical protein
MANFNYCITAVVGVLCFAVGASAESMGGRPGNEVGDFGEVPTGIGSGKTIERSSLHINSIDLAGGQRRRIGEASAKVVDWRPSNRVAGHYFPVPNKHNEAERLFRSALHKQINNDLTGAIADYLEAIKIDDNDPSVHWYLGTACEAAGNATEAKQEFEKEQAMNKSKSLSINVRGRYSGGYGSGTGRGYGGGDFGSNKLKFVPGEGLTKPHSNGK